MHPSRLHRRERGIDTPLSRLRARGRGNDTPLSRFRERGRGRGHAFRDGIRNPLQDTFHIFHDFVVPEPQHGISMFAQPDVAPTVVFHFFRMLAAVNLDYEPERGTGKINNIWTDGLLPFELQIKKTMGAQVVPQPLLGIGHDSAQAFGAYKRASPSWVHVLTFASPLPQLFPPGRTNFLCARSTARMSTGHSRIPRLTSRKAGEGSSAEACLVVVPWAESAATLRINFHALCTRCS